MNRNYQAIAIPVSGLANQLHNGDISALATDVNAFFQSVAADNTDVPLPQNIVSLQGALHRPTGRRAQAEPGQHPQSTGTWWTSKLGSTRLLYLTCWTCLRSTLRYLQCVGARRICPSPMERSECHPGTQDLPPGLLSLIFGRLLSLRRLESCWNRSLGRGFWSASTKLLNQDHAK